ncbi:alpha/beta hydrolase [Lysobacter niastensis]|uniref:Alpha/beta hydrolase n=1 Tax=Lysobacter niastensis TaxID=380629 RepID=A0ABS0B3W4_9GAMM|nr:alpha/beta fold hydrolase [Lysobacter niastensis]MBF6023180.1 alpha/beta hydrolase [Lysobacter niastensis]
MTTSSDERRASRPAAHAPHGLPPRSLARRLLAAVARLARKSALLVVLVVLALVGMRAYLATQGPVLRPWHTLVPDEPSAGAISRDGWPAYVAAEARMFEQLHRRMQSSLEAGDRTPLNRYYDPSLASPASFGHDWNRSFVLEPSGAIRGVAVLVHGLTDSPYSMRTLAELYRQHGFVAIAPRMPGHGTVPAALTREGRKEWMAAVDIAMDEARRRAAGRLPVHLVGYSNGAALSLLHVMRRAERGERRDVDQLVLLSPMIEVNAFARYAGLAGLPALFPRYAKSAWLDLLPEYNPFKYNSFPVRAARESYLVTADLQKAMASVAAQQRMDQVPPILAFQSVVDDTVGARAVVTRLFDTLGSNGSELVLFDVNRKRVLNPLLSPQATDWARHALQGPPRRYTLTLVGTASDDDASVVARSRAAGANGIEVLNTGMTYPADVFSLSHVALPFPPDDPLYGNRPSGLRIVPLGSVAVRGERRALVVSQDSLSRLSYNPFHAYMAARISAKIPSQETGGPGSSP